MWTCFCLVNWIINILPVKYFKRVFRVGKSYVAVCFNYFLKTAVFNIIISQGSVAIQLRCGGIFTYEFVVNLPLSLIVKEFWKSVNIWGSYGQEFSVVFWLWTTRESHRRHTASTSEWSVHGNDAAYVRLLWLLVTLSLFFFFRTDYMIPHTFTVTSEHIHSYFKKSFSVLRFLVVVSVR